MEKTAIDDVEPSAVGSESVRRGLSAPLGTTDVAVNRYRIAPGEGFPAGLHAHADQEEVFVVVSGEATFETLAPREARPSRARDPSASAVEGREVTVAAGEAVRFAPGEFQSGRNDADTDLVAFALGAPRDSEDVRLPLSCPECGRDDVCLDFDEEGATFVCPDCGDERVPRGCPECGGELHVALGETREAGKASEAGGTTETGDVDGAGVTVIVCPDCGATFENPPVRE